MITAGSSSDPTSILFNQLLGLFWDDNDSLRFQVDPDGVHCQAVWLDDEDVESCAPINPADVAFLQSTFDAEKATGSISPWEFIEAYVDDRLAAGTGEGFGSAPFVVDGFTRHVLSVFADHGGLSWYGDGARFVANCSDFFFWGSSDAEDITPDGLDLLDTAHRVATTAGRPDWTGPLFAALRRGMRPQGAYYEMIPTELIEAFDACGPEREADFGNPLTREQGLARGTKRVAS